MSPAHLDQRIPAELLATTKKMLAAMGRLRKPEKSANQAQRDQLRDRCARVERAWKSLQRVARQTLGDGNKLRVSFFAWQGSIWKDPAYRTYDAVSGYWRQQTDEYRRYKGRYDECRRRLKKLGIWEQAKARRRFQGVVDRLVEAHADPDRYGQSDRVTLVHSMMQALEQIETVGQFCPTCESANCRHPPMVTDLHIWLDRAREWGRQLRAERQANPRASNEGGIVGVDEPPFEPPDGSDLFDDDEPDDHEPEYEPEPEPDYDDDDWEAE